MFNRPPEALNKYNIRLFVYFFVTILSSFFFHCFTIDGLLELIPNLRFTGTFRHPAAVALSLYNRGKMPQEEAYNLWYLYNERLVAYNEKFDFYIVNFNLETDAYLLRVSEALNRMGVFHSNKNFCFFDSSLRNVKLDFSQRLPPMVNALYHKLLEISL